jgi:glycosyltransferase involved in cell wall biosynthesis
MKVALVHDYFREYGGAERVVEVLHEMFPEAPVYTSYYFPDKMPDTFKSWNIRTTGMQRWWGIKNHYLYYTYLVPWAFEQINLSSYDLVISSSAFAAKGVITHPDQIHINYCHTPTRFLWGLNRSTKHNGIMKRITGILNGYLKQWDYAAAQRVDHFIANSRTVQARINKFYGRDSEVIYPPIALARHYDGGACSRDLGLPSSYYLMVSRMERLKNVDVVIKAFTALNLPLVIVGTGTQMGYMRLLAGKTISFPGFLVDQDLAYVYAHARGFIAAATDEDFGMTVPEALSFGTPVIAYKDGGYVESVTEGETGTFFESLDTAAIHNAIARFEKMEFDREHVKQSATQFSLETFHKKILDVIEDVSHSTSV